MWKTKHYYLTNLEYALLWKPKKNITYRTKSNVSSIGYHIGTTTEIKFIDKNGKEIGLKSFRINDDNILTTKRGKKIYEWNANDFKFKKNVKRDTYWGQGGGSIRTFTYTIIHK